MLTHDTTFHSIYTSTTVYKEIFSKKLIHADILSKIDTYMYMRSKLSLDTDTDVPTDEYTRVPYLLFYCLGLQIHCILTHIAR